jgi:hypothetical protein
VDSRVDEIDWYVKWLETSSARERSQGVVCWCARQSPVGSLRCSKGEDGSEAEGWGSLVTRIRWSTWSKLWFSALKSLQLSMNQKKIVNALRAFEFLNCWCSV